MNKKEELFFKICTILFFILLTLIIVFIIFTSLIINKWFNQSYLGTKDIDLRIDKEFLGYPKITSKFSGKNLRICAVNVNNISFRHKDLTDIYEDKYDNFKILQGKNYGTNIPLGIVCENEKNIEFYFRSIELGSKEYRVFLKPNQVSFDNEDPTIKCHQGSLKIFNTIREEIEEIIKNNINGKNIFIAGHSMGGILGTYTAKLALEANQQTLLYTMGSPMFCNKKFAKYIESFEDDNLIAMYRVHSSNDLVPVLTPSFMPTIFKSSEEYDYSFIGKSIRFNTLNNSIKYNHSSLAFYESKKYIL